MGKSKFSRYFDKEDGMFHESNLKNVFEPWDFDKILREPNKWRLKARWLFVYIIANHRGESLQAYVGCNQDPYKRLAQHNSEEPGGPSSTRKAPGDWELIMYTIVPPMTNYSSKDLVGVCKGGRGWISRCKKSINIAMQRGLDWRITRKIADQTSDYYAPSILEILNGCMTQEQIEKIYIDNASKIPEGAEIVTSDTDISTLFTKVD